MEFFASNNIWVALENFLKEKGISYTTQEISDSVKKYIVPEIYWDYIRGFCEGFNWCYNKNYELYF